MVKGVLPLPDTCSPTVSLAIGLIYYQGSYTRTMSFSRIETHDRELLVGDAFAEDKKVKAAKGLAVTERSSLIPSSSGVFTDTPECKCNSVSFMRPESLAPLPLHCRNLVAVSERFICYSPKRTMLRVIQVASAEKDLLKGHQHSVLDLKFSATDDSILCSVDAGADDGDAGAAGAAVNIWRLTE